MSFTAQIRQHDNVDQRFLQDVITGLSQTQKKLPCKYFYDDRGSLLFEQICATPEYYVTRAECDIYQQYAGQIAAFIGARALIIEPGAGSVKKIGLLLRQLEQPAGFIPMDISADMLSLSSELLADDFPDLDITPVIADFLDRDVIKDLFSRLPTQPLINKSVIFFPGSTIGNFHPRDAEQFLRSLADNLQLGDGLLIGVDLLKKVAILERAYNDEAGITADFNLNVLQRINRELNGNFSLEQFAHQARFNQDKSRIEMHLVSTQSQRVQIADQVVAFDKHESIHTENSYKYSVVMFSELARRAGFSLQHYWHDKRQLFSVYYLSLDPIK